MLYVFIVLLCVYYTLATQFLELPAWGHRMLHRAVWTESGILDGILSSEGLLTRETFLTAAIFRSLTSTTSEPRSSWWSNPPPSSSSSSSFLLSVFPSSSGWGELAWLEISPRPSSLSLSDSPWEPPNFSRLSMWLRSGFKLSSSELSSALPSSEVLLLLTASRYRCCCERTIASAGQEELLLWFTGAAVAADAAVTAAAEIFSAENVEVLLLLLLLLLRGDVCCCCCCCCHEVGLACCCGMPCLAASVVVNAVTLEPEVSLLFLKLLLLLYELCCWARDFLGEEFLEDQGRRKSQCYSYPVCHA